MRGRIFTATGVSLNTGQLTLGTMHADRRIGGSHDAVYRTSARVQNINGDRSHVGTTFFAGTDDVEAATPIVVGKATQHDAFDFVVRTE